LGSTRLELGTVLSHQPGTNRIDVRLQGVHQRVLRKVLIPAEGTFQQDDTVLICKVTSANTWLAIVKVADEDEYGLALSKVAGDSDLHPPSNLAVTGLPGFILGAWDAWPGNAICFEIQANDTGAESGGPTSYSYGNVYLYPGLPPDRLYMRVRSLRYAPSEAEAYWSAWTSWGDAVPLMTAEMVANQVDELKNSLETLWAMHLEGEL
jgi:hypothetical protein